ncbi:MULTISPECIES: ABC transporter permease [Pseudomonas]|uniref:ABC transporter permease n=1 Tax=Pseudomonas TaxID=286 RepID=UPI000CFDD1F8|nr:MULTISPECIES: ABC transporter permease [Pseudomonas]PQZ91837.1 ABC transporter permease [Pseudomonas trivialis]PRB27804.1 ABC transporter permease [Pseudomonas sp. MYb60]
MKRMPVIFKHQLASYAHAPSTYLSVAVFLALSVAMGLYMGPWTDLESGNLQAYFALHPWFYLLLIPVLATQLWSSESNAGLFNLMKTLPIRPIDLIIGKFLAAWIVSALALLLMLPLVITSNVLGIVDNQVIASQFLASWLLAGSYLSVGCFICTFAHQRITIFIMTLGLLLIASGLSSVLDSLQHQAPIWVVDSLSTLSPLVRFNEIDNGKLTLRDILYFISMILAFLTATLVTLDYKHS